MTIRPVLAVEAAAIIAIVSLLSACASLVQAEPKSGYIAEAGVSQLRVCFNGGVLPAVGRLVYFVGNANTPRPGYKSLRPVGTARISAIESDGCASAIVLEGNPHANDAVRLSGNRADRGSAFP